MTRCGIGYDVHRLVPGRKLILGGIEIASDRGLEGHSDADVLSHAIADAILGAAGERDIGHHFPNTDPACEDMSSLEILRQVRDILRQKGKSIVNVDATVLAEAPRIAPHIETMRAVLAKTLGLAAADVGIKATTNEGLGPVGRGEGMAAFAVATIEVSA